MRRSLLPATLVTALAAMVPATAAAKTIELGATKTALVAPTCPTGVNPKTCTIILTEITALETLRDGISYPTTVKSAGQIVAFTLGLSKLDNNRKTAKTEVHGLDSQFGGVPLAAITVLKQTGKKKLRRYKVVAESTAVHLIPYLGQVAQFPLSKPLPVSPGEVVALSVPTWAPILSINQPAKSFAYRQGRTGHCTTPSATALAQKVGQSTEYNCNYAGTRIEYSATEITNPRPTPGHFAGDQR